MGEAVAAVPLAAAVVVITVGIARAIVGGAAGPAQLAASVGLGLEFLLAAGLLRLSSIDDFAALAVVAALVVLRKLIVVGIRAGLRALGLAAVQRIRA